MATEDSPARRRGEAYLVEYCPGSAPKCSLAWARAAVAVYRHGNHQVDLFAWADKGAPLPPSGISRGFRTRFWKIGDLDFAAVSDIDVAEFRKFTDLAQAQRE